MCDDIEDLDKKCGFQRPRDGDQLGTVDLFNKHLFVFTGLIESLHVYSTYLYFQ